MSTEIGVLKNSGPCNVDLSVTRFSGGKKGMCVQLGARNEHGEYMYIQLTKNDISQLIPVLYQLFFSIESVEFNRFKYDGECKDLYNEK